VVKALEPLQPDLGRVRFLAMRPIDVSSSTVRELVAAGMSTDGLLPRRVAAYLAKHRLYGAHAG
jgi:nicotinic acid mononucleotide adenylyltransferase